MRNVSISPQDTGQWQHEAVKRTLAPVIPFKSIEGDLAPASGPALGAEASLGLFKFDPDAKDRKLVDALVVIALTVFIHSLVIDHFKHPPVVVEPPKETKVEITLLAPPPPPPPPPVVQPQPRPAPPKDAIPPKPKPKPKKIPPPVVETPPVPDVPISDTAPAAPVQAAPPAPPAPPVEKVVQVSNADYVRKPEPEYPADAQERGWEGKVLVKARILPSGQTDVVQVQKSSGRASLDAAAVRAVKGALFKPNMQGSTATTVWAIIPITFQL